MIEAGPVGAGAFAGRPDGLCGEAEPGEVGTAPATGSIACGWGLGTMACAAVGRLDTVAVVPDPHPPITRARMAVAARRLIALR